MSLKTNVGHKFLRLLDKHFPKGSSLYPIFNRKKIKLGYRCMPNMGAKIDKHNSKIARRTTGAKGYNVLASNLTTTNGI